jgi:hypothetical protein
MQSELYQWALDEISRRKISSITKIEIFRGEIHFGCTGWGGKGKPKSMYQRFEQFAKDFRTKAAERDVVVAERAYTVEKALRLW